MKKFLKLTALSAAVLALAACGSRSDVTAEGTTDNPQFPQLSDSHWNHNGSQKGSWIDWNSVKQIEKGMNKEQVYHLIGEPHFHAGLYNVHEWDYAFNYRENGEHKVCQYKVLFDENMNVSQQWWLPNGCGAGALAPYELSADSLFDFDSATLTAEGQNVVAKLAQDLNNAKSSGVKVVGYTDRLGSDAYNLDLSKRRAESVKSALVAAGVSANISTEGLGKANQVKACEAEHGQALRDCLKPNRRVVVSAEGGAVAQENNLKAGLQGPAVVEQYKNNATSWK